jgi:Zn-dependent peptidase ImmA (M78 family)
MNKAALGRLAEEVRSDFGLSKSDPFNPFRWSEEHGIPFISLRDFTADEAAMHRFLDEKPHVWSAALVQDGNRHFVIYNPLRSRARLHSDLTHEIAHIEAEHEPGPAWTDDRGCGGASKSQENEAAELAGAILVPPAAAKEAAIFNRSPQSVADRYEVSIELAQWRMRVSGGYVIAQRARSRRGSRQH